MIIFTKFKTKIIKKKTKVKNQNKIENIQEKNIYLNFIL